MKESNEPEMQRRHQVHKVLVRLALPPSHFLLVLPRVDKGQDGGNEEGNDNVHHCNDRIGGIIHQAGVAEDGI